MMVKVTQIEHMLIQWMITKISGVFQVLNMITKIIVLHGNGIYMVIILMVVATMIIIAWNTMISE